MKPVRRSIPFSVTILTLMALVLVPLACVLLWLGWRSVDQLEQRSADQRVSNLEAAVEDFLTDGLHVVVSVGQALAAGPSFNATEESAGRRRSAGASSSPCCAVIATVQSAFVGYADGSFIYAGPAGTSDRRPAARVRRAGRRIDHRPGDRGGHAAAGGNLHGSICLTAAASTAQTTTSFFDPRTRPWYVAAMQSKAPILTDPYRFEQTADIGISAGVPLRTGIGVIGFDFTLRTLSELLTAYKITANSVIVIGHSGVSSISSPNRAAPTLPDCLPGDALVRQMLREAVAEVIDTDARIDRRVNARGHEYRLLVHRMPVMLEQRFVIATAVPVLELTANSQELLQRAAIVAAFAVALAVLGTLVASLVLSRALGRIAAQDRAYPSSSTSPTGSRYEAASAKSRACPMRSRTCARGWRSSGATSPATSCSRSCVRPRAAASAARAARSR